MRSHKLFADYQKRMEKLKATADQIEYKRVANTGDDKHVFAKITEKSDHRVKIHILLYGEGSEVRETPQRSYNVEFLIPDEIKPYGDEIETSQLSLMTSPASRFDNGYMILKNGLYLKRAP